MQPLLCHLKRLQRERELREEREKATVFGGARPVDTASREKEIEEKLRQKQKQEEEERQRRQRDRKGSDTERRGKGRERRGSERLVN